MHVFFFLEIVAFGFLLRFLCKKKYKVHKSRAEIDIDHFCLLTWKNAHLTGFHRYSLKKTTLPDIANPDGLLSLKALSKIC
jgi:hypothetical protein